MIMKQTIKINKKEFLDWRFSDKSDLPYLAECVINNLKSNYENTVSINTIWKITQYIPISLVQNKNEINLEEADYDNDTKELYPEDFNVEWI